uniref:hypothetical protein n=1 Tax=Duncaniella muris TaxID=2094150 RepID=UPI0025A5E4AC
VSALIFQSLKKSLADSNNFEYIYSGKVVGKTVVFDKITVTVRNGVRDPDARPKPAPKNEPNVITLLSPTTFDFSGLKFTKMK